MAIDPTNTTLYPVPSKRFDIAARNAEDLDRAVNGGNHLVTTRNGRQIPSLEKIAFDLGAVTFRGDYAGATAYTVYDAVFDAAEVLSSPGAWYIAPAAFTSIDIATDVAAGDLALFRDKSVLPFGSISELQGKTFTDGQQISVAGYHSGSTEGGGVFVWGIGRHNGGTFIDPSRPFPADWNDQEQLAAWFADSGVNVVGFKRVNSTNLPTSAFSVIAGGADNFHALTAALKTLRPLVHHAGMCGLSAKIKMPAGSTIVGDRSFLHGFYALPGFVGNTLIETTGENVVKGVKLVGLESCTISDVEDLVSETYFNTREEALAQANIGSLSGVITAGDRIDVSDNYITQFNAYAIDTLDNNVVTQQPLNRTIKGNVLHLNMCGLREKEASEYSEIAGNTINYNFYGVINTGGNNNYNGNHIDHNRVNMMLVTGANDAHGQVTGGTMNHGVLAILIAEDIRNGMLFNGVSMFDGGSLGISIKNSRGIQIKGGVIAECDITNDGAYNDPISTGVNVISNCLMSLMSSSGTHRVTELATDRPSNLKMFDNYALEGDSSTVWENEILNNNKMDIDLWQKTGSNVPLIKGLNPASLYVVNSTGAIRIKLGDTNIFNNSVINMLLRITDPNGTFKEVRIQGFMNGSSGWEHTTVAAPVGVQSLNVRFGGSNPSAGSSVGYVYVGELGDVNVSQYVEVVEFNTFGSSVYNTKKDWKHGLSITVEGSFENVTATKSVSSEYLTYNGDLNDIDYNLKAFSNAAINRPVAQDGFIESLVSDAGSTNRIQRFTTLSGVEYRRGMLSGVWQTWS